MKRYFFLCIESIYRTVRMQSWALMLTTQKTPNKLGGIKIDYLNNIKWFYVHKDYNLSTAVRYI